MVSRGAKRHPLLPSKRGALPVTMEFVNQIRDEQVPNLPRAAKHHCWRLGRGRLATTDHKLATEAVPEGRKALVLI